jgi:hypothetical protein
VQISSPGSGYKDQSHGISFEEAQQARQQAQCPLKDLWNPSSLSREANQRTDHEGPSLVPERGVRVHRLYPAYKPRTICASKSCETPHSALPIAGRPVSKAVKSVSGIVKTLEQPHGKGLDENLMSTSDLPVGRRLRSRSDKVCYKELSEDGDSQSVCCTCACAV